MVLVSSIEGVPIQGFMLDSKVAAIFYFPENLKEIYPNLPSKT
ncbi:MAG TPA: hypothetical protein V6D09_04065 [Leptolyngbyaceae cyanobacterium]